MKRLLATVLVLGGSFCFAADPPKTDARYPFRTDFANADLPWYQPRPGEFPPHHSEHRISGELVQADFIHRTGQFRASQTGELMDFALPPYGTVSYLNAESDLRDVPLGTFFLFFLHQDRQGRFTRLATMQDQFTIDAGQEFTYRLDALKLGEGKLLTTKHSMPKSLQDLGKQELLVTEQTRVWKGDQQVALADLTVGAELLFNLTNKTSGSPGRCTDIWVGTDTHKLVTDKQRGSCADFVKARGVPAWIDAVAGNTLTVTLFSGEPQLFSTIYPGVFNLGKAIRVVVANDELRTWNPPVDQERSKIQEVQKAPLDCYGSSGVRLVFTVPNMLEGFRKGRIVRVIGGDWPRKDQDYGEGLMNYGLDKLRTAELMELPPKEYPVQFPFRTDHGNVHLPWYQLKPGVVPPRFSEHLVFGELVTVDAAQRSGQFRTDRTGALVDFTLTPEGSVRYLQTNAKLSDLALGRRYRFDLYQDDKGAFTRASRIGDEFSFLADNIITYRIEVLKLAEGKLLVARQIPPVRNYNGDQYQPPDIGRTELRVNADTRVWKGDQQVKLADLAVGDALLVSLTSEQTGHPSTCTDIWVGAETHRLAADQQAKKNKAAKE